MSKSYEALHEALLKEMPEGAHHEPDRCPICSSRATASQEENVDEAKFTQEQLDQLVSAAVEKAKEEASASTDAEILRLNEQLKQAEEKAEASEAKVSELEASISERDETERLAKLADDRAALVKAAVNFSDEQIDARKASWASKTEEEFEALIEDYKAAAEAATASSEGEGEGTPPESSFDGTRQTAGDQTGPKALEEFFSVGLVGVQ